MMDHTPVMIRRRPGREVLLATWTSRHMAIVRMAHPSRAQRRAIRNRTNMRVAVTTFLGFAFAMSMARARMKARKLWAGKLFPVAHRTS